MRCRRLIALSLVLTAWSVCTCYTIDAHADPAPTLADRASMAPFFRKYCLECHGADGAEADIRLDGIQISNPADETLWKRVRRVLGRREMPPEDHDQPASDELKFAIQWIDESVFRIDSRQPHPGK